MAPRAVEEDVDTAALAVIAFDTSQEKAKAADKRRKKELADAQKLLAELKKNGAPRRRSNSRAFLESVQNSITLRR